MVDSVQQIGAAPTNPLPQLFVPGERIGWIFQDRNLFRRRFLPPAPTPGAVAFELVNRLKVAQQKQVSRMMLAGGIGLGLALLFGCCGSVSASTTAGGSEGSAFYVLAFLAVVGGIGGAAIVWAHANGAKARLAQAQEDLRRQYEMAYSQWDQARRAYETQQQEQVDAMYEWGAATPSPGTRRVDIVGGTTWGWEAALTVFGGSLLSSRGALTLVDFSNEGVCAELVALANATNTSVDVRFLPSQLAETNLLDGLDPRQVVDALVESMYGDAPAASRADRLQDNRLLGDICDVLGEHLTMGRLAAGLQVLMDQSRSSVLTAEEVSRIGDLLSDEGRRQAHQSLRRIEAFVHPLTTMGTAEHRASEAVLTCLVAESDGRNSQSELIKDLTIQWLIRRVSSDASNLRSLVIVGADEVDHRHIERLGTLCERRNIRLVLFFEHLREASLHALGGGEVAFMRLANHEEARQAAEFIGHQHKFVISQLTRTLGGNDTHTIANQEGGSDSESMNFGSSRGPEFQLSTHRGRSWTKTRNWSQTISVAEGTNWSDAASAQRVYEYAVEPRVLQDLPDYAMLLVKGQDRGSVLQAVECDPAIVTLPRVTMDPLPYTPLPSPDEAVIPLTGSPGEVTISQPSQFGIQPVGVPAAGTGMLPGWGGAPTHGQTFSQPNSQQNTPPLPPSQWRSS